MSITTSLDFNPLTQYWRAFSFDVKQSPVTQLKASYVLRMRHAPDGRVIVRCSNLQGVVTDGSNEDEALLNAIEAIDGMLEARNLDKEYNITLINT